MDLEELRRVVDDAITTFKYTVPSSAIRRLAAFGIVLPFGVVVACNALRRILGDLNAIEWMTIIAGFWWIAGMLITGIALIRDALRRD
jgi:hypothetical protein